MSDFEYWSWPVGALALGFVALAHPILTGRPVAVSGIFSRALSWRKDEIDRRDEEALAEGDLDAALLAATLEEFGDLGGPVARDEEAVQEFDASLARLPLSAGLTFLFAMALGGFLSAWSLNAFSFQWSLGASFDAAVQMDALRLALPVGGGLLVGFGASMAGGCTSSHGLAGCARFQPGSLLATAMFFLGGIIASQLLRVWL